MVTLPSHSPPALPLGLTVLQPQQRHTSSRSLLWQTPLAFATLVTPNMTNPLSRVFALVHQSMRCYSSCQLAQRWRGDCCTVQGWGTSMCRRQQHTQRSGSSRVQLVRRSRAGWRAELPSISQATLQPQSAPRLPASSTTGFPTASAGVVCH